jgi:hypothetical protein
MSISYAARDPRDGTIWAAMDHAHWGPTSPEEPASRLAFPVQGLGVVMARG